MKFTYHWKTPDNERHEGEIEAQDRESAFAELRKRGIRAIKVEPIGGAPGKDVHATGLKLRIGAILAMLAFGVALGFLLAKRTHEPDATDPHGIVGSSRYAAFLKAADGIRDGHRAALGKLKLDWARNYALIESMKDVTPITEQLDRGQAAVKYARARVSDLFRDVLTLFPATNAQERASAQRLYGELMDELDLDEYNLSCAYMAVAMLTENRGRWHEDEGRVVWSDEKLRREFEPYATDSDAATARWRRDFAVGGK